MTSWWDEWSHLATKATDIQTPTVSAGCVNRLFAGRLAVLTPGRDVSAFRLQLVTLFPSDQTKKKNKVEIKLVPITSFQRHLQVDIILFYQLQSKLTCCEMIKETWIRISSKENFLKADVRCKYFQNRPTSSLFTASSFCVFFFYWLSNDKWFFKACSVWWSNEKNKGWVRAALQTLVWFTRVP